MSIDNDNLLWIDFETTGLMSEPYTEPLELAAIITDAHGTELEVFPSAVFAPSNDSMKHMSDFVRSMHTGTGLLERVENEAIILEYADQELCSIVTKWFPEGGAVVAGNSVGGLDRPILQKFFPRTSALCTYRVLDVSSIEQMVAREDPELHLSMPPKTSDHTAMHDIRESIRQYRHYTTGLFAPRS